MDAIKYQQHHFGGGPSYDLSMEYYPKLNDSGISSIIKLIFELDFIQGPFGYENLMKRDIPTVYDEETDADFYGILSTSDQKEFPYRVYVTRIEHASDWINVIIPAGAMELYDDAWWS